ncbi:MAG TPA: sigma-70 family RNA polymerase sigma factor [Candidatus Polarisedimenticolia bacterium]|jgi:RNA polymerase sigma factor (sigma-70 family)|nr:sigma-70 family RNA polymerase sigma factor [Candidatus Polarisedimenticolia bacterium]
MPGGGDRFPTTHFSVVRGASSDRPEERARSLEAIVAAYWRPVYKLVRLRFGRPPEDAEDLTQAFFTRALEKDFFAGFDPVKGRFRTYLRTCVDRFVANEDKAATRLKRGGGATTETCDFASAEAEIAVAGAAARDRSPEELFDAEWVRSLFALAVESLRAACASAGKEQHFELFRRYDLEDAGEGKVTYDDLAREFGTTPSLVTNHLAWTRREFRRILLDTLRQVTSSDEEFRLEARLLLGTAPADPSSHG